jgi:RNA polymerase sigma factor (sigma-70 family)
MQITSKQLFDCFDSYSAGLVLYARQMAADGFAEDVVQDAFVKLAAQREVPVNVRAWLIVTVRNVAFDSRKLAKRRQVRALEVGRARMLERRAGSEGWLEPAEVEAGLAMLDVREREVVVLKIWNGATFQEIAELMGMPLSTVYEHYQSGLEMLRKKWGASCK